MLPHRHLISNYATINGISLEYLDSLQNLKKGVKRKAEDIDDNINDVFSEIKGWEKGRASFANIHKFKPSYQNNIDVEKLEAKSIFTKKA